MCMVSQRAKSEAHTLNTYLNTFKCNLKFPFFDQLRPHCIVCISHTHLAANLHTSTQFPYSYM